MPFNGVDNQTISSDHLAAVRCSFNKYHSGPLSPDPRPVSTGPPLEHWSGLSMRELIEYDEELGAKPVKKT